MCMCSKECAQRLRVLSYPVVLLGLLLVWWAEDDLWTSKCWHVGPTVLHTRPDCSPAFQTTTLWLGRAAGRVPGDQDGEGPHRADEVKEGRSCWVRVTSALWHRLLHADPLNPASNVTRLDLLLWLFLLFCSVGSIYSCTLCGFLVEHRMISIKTSSHGTLEDCYDVISVNGSWPSDLADEFWGQCSLLLPLVWFYKRSILISTFQTSNCKSL